MKYEEFRQFLESRNVKIIQMCRDISVDIQLSRAQDIIDISEGEVFMYENRSKTDRNGGYIEIWLYAIHNMRLFGAFFMVSE